MNEQYETHVQSHSISATSYSFGDEVKMQNESDSQPTTGGKEEKLVKQGKENNMNATNPVTLKGYFTTIKGIAPAKPQPTLKPAKPSTPQKTYTQVTLAHIFKLPTKEKEVAIVPDTPSTMKRASKIKKSKKPAIIDQTEQKGQESTQAIHPRRKRKYDDVLAQVQVLDGEGNGIISLFSKPPWLTCTRNSNINSGEGPSWQFIVARCSSEYSPNKEECSSQNESYW